MHPAAKMKAHPADSTRARGRARFAISKFLATCLLTIPLAVTAGIPEPDLVWYGKVQTVSGGQVIRVTSGVLAWQIEPLSGGASWTGTTRLTNINDQFSFVLRVPCETPEPGVPASAETIVLTSPPATYRRLNVTLDGQSLSFQSGATQFSPSLNDRGRAERIDLALGTLLPDSDGDGLADPWEQQYFGNLAATANADPDGDGMSNLKEYRAGTNPTDPRSLFELIEIQPQAGGIRVRWSSQPNRSYNVRRSSSLLASPAAYPIIQSGVVATGLTNEFLDISGLNQAQQFYIIEVQE